VARSISNCCQPQEGIAMGENVVLTAMVKHSDSPQERKIMSLRLYIVMFSSILAQSIKKI
jgi:hypothetical protein